MGHRVPTLVVLGALMLVVTGCATHTVLARAARPAPPSPGARILLMEPDIQLYELTAAGLLEPKADWTATAQTNVGAALAQLFAAKQAVTVPYAVPGDAAREHTHEQLIKLHERVGATILTFRYDPGLRLPGKGDVFDWTLGDAAKTLGEDFDVDYALFVRFLDSYASAGRVATIAVFALLGAVIPGGTQIGFGSLVDLKTGDLVWFNRLVNPAGDLRTPQSARDAVQALLADFPL